MQMFSVLGRLPCNPAWRTTGEDRPEMSHAGHDDAVPVDPVAGFRHLGPRKQKPLKFARKIRGLGLMYGGEIGI